MSAVETYPIALDLKLPWQPDEAQEAAFKRTLTRLLVPLLLLFLIIPWLPVFEKEYKEREIDIVKTQIILEPVIEPTPEPTAVPVVKKPKPKPVSKPKATPRGQPKTEPKAKAKPKARPKRQIKPKKPKPISQAQKKKNVAKAQGLTAISSQLDSLRQSLDLTKLQNKTVSKSKGGKIARADRSVIGQERLTRKSTGIVVDDSLMKNENIALAAHKSTKLDGFIGGGGSASSLNRQFNSDLRRQRSDESIRRVFEAGKSKAYMLYLRELRNTPGLSGTLVFQVVIEANGRISRLKLVSSELNSPQLEQKILNTVRRLNFGSKDVSPRSLRYKFNFLPS